MNTGDDQVESRVWGILDCWSDKMCFEGFGDKMLIFIENFAQQPIHVFNDQINNLNAYNPPSSPQRYTVVEAKSKVRKWAWYLKVLGWVLIIFGIISAIGELGYMDEQYNPYIDFGSLPMRPEQLAISKPLKYTAIILDFTGDVLTALLGYFGVKTSFDPTRNRTWKLFKKGVVIIIIKFFLATFAFLLLTSGYTKAYTKWVEDNNLNHSSSHNASSSSTSSDDQDSNQKEKEEMNQSFSAGSTIFLSLLFAFGVMGCGMVTCSSCTLGFLYKFYSDAKEYDIIHNSSLLDHPNEHHYDMNPVQPISPIRPVYNQTIQGTSQNIATRRTISPNEVTQHLNKV